METDETEQFDGPSTQEDVTTSESENVVELPTKQSERVPMIRLIEIESESEQFSSDLATPMEESENFVPLSLDYFAEHKVIELSRYAWRGSSKRQRFLRGCLWSPDGSCVLTTVNGDGMHVVELPTDLYSSHEVSVDRPVDLLQSAVHIKEGGTVYDCCWFPFMNSSDPTSCFWIASRQHEPIQLWDAYNGTLRSSYRGYNAVDEVEPALSVAFSPDGAEVIGGYKDSLKLFKTDVPGRDYTTITLKSPASALAINSTGHTIAIGSWTGTISLRDPRDEKSICYYELIGHNGGITCLKFLHTKNLLISGARKDNELLVWDMRKSTEPIHRLSRNVTTNQRIYFDVSANEKWLVSGDTTGVMHTWNIENFDRLNEMNVRNI